MVQAYDYVMIIALFFSSVNSLSQHQQQRTNNNIFFGSSPVLRNNLISNNNANANANVGTNTNNTSADDDGKNNNNNNNHVKNRGWQYWCDPCSCGFNKAKSYTQHIAGKRHDAVIAESENLWADYKKSGPAFYDPCVLKEDVTRSWSLDLFMDGLQARSRSSIKHVLVTGVSGGQLDPSLRLCNLNPQKRAALWRFLHINTSGVPGLSSMVAALPPHYVRVKEVLESIETFKHVERLMKRSTSIGEKATKISHIYDIGCGHGLVAMLCAASFPHITVHAIDLVPRDSFRAQCEAFSSTGTTLDNLTFEAGDLSILHDRAATDEGCDGDAGGQSLLLCVHGCKSLTHESIELAERNNWAWLSLPCCLQSENHLDERTSLKVADGTRFAMLCGAIAAKYKAETVTTIDSRITGRGIVLASSGKVKHE